MKPTNKAPAIDAFLSELTGKDRKATIEANECVMCDNPNMNFRNGRSAHEYRISGLCQNCQDEIFGF